MVSNNFQISCGILNNAQIVVPLPATTDTKKDGSIASMWFLLNCDYLNVVAELKTHQSR